MNTTQTPPVPTLSLAAHALLADFADPDLSELDLARRHGLTLDQLRSAARAPAFRRALAAIRELQDLRRPLILARAEAEAARTLTALAARPPTSATAAKESRLATKALLKLLGAGGFQPPDRPKADAPNLGAGGFQPPDRAQPDAPTLGAGAFQAPDWAKPDAPHGGADFQSAIQAHPEPRESPNPSTPPNPPSGGVGPAAPTPQPPASSPNPHPTDAPARPSHKPKRPRNTKPRPKPRSR